MATTSKIASASSTGRLHVLQVVGNAIAGGMETYVSRLIERLPREGFTTTVLCPYESPYTERLRRLDIEVLITPMPPDNPPWCSVQLASTLIRTGAIDILHAHMPNAHLLAGIAASITGRPIVTTIHRRQLTALDLELHRTVGSHIAVVCKQSYFHALAMGVNAAKLSCIPNGVDTQVFMPGKEGRGAEGTLRARLGISPHAPVVGFVGRLHWEKGPDIFMQAILLIAHRFPDAHFVLVGDGPMRGPLAQLVQRFDLQERVHLTGVFDDMPEIYKDFDIAVSASYSEAMPLAVMEAMASGLPVIGTSVGGVPDLIEQEQTGYLVTPGDAKAIADLLVFLLENPEQRSAMGARARARAIRHFALNQSVERVAQVLTRLVAGRNEPRRMGALPRNNQPAQMSVGESLSTGR